MRTFFRRYFTHARFVSATAQPLDELKLDTLHAGSTRLDLSQMYIDLRPYMNRCVLLVGGCLYHWGAVQHEVVGL
jgi:chloride channel 7